MEFNNQVAVVTGAASGIGRAVAQAMALRGVRAVGLVDMNESIDQIAAELNMNSFASSVSSSRAASLKRSESAAAQRISWVSSR